MLSIKFKVKKAVASSSCSLDLPRAKVKVFIGSTLCTALLSLNEGCMHDVAESEMTSSSRR